MKPITRREFTRTLAAVSTTAALSSFRVFGANDRVRLGFIGVGNRGDQVLDAFLKQSDAEIVAVCDIYEPYLDFAARKVGTGPKRFKDYRQLLELKDVDAVVISTPITGMRCKPSMPARPGKMYMSRSRSRCASPRGGRWFRR